MKLQSQSPLRLQIKWTLVNEETFLANHVCRLEGQGEWRMEKNNNLRPRKAARLLQLVSYMCFAEVRYAAARAVPWDDDIKKQCA
jgi:hypothetical protein